MHRPWRVYGAATPTPRRPGAPLCACPQAFSRRYGPGEVRVYHARGTSSASTDYNHGYVMPVALTRTPSSWPGPRSDGRTPREPGGRFPPRTFTISAIPRSPWATGRTTPGPGPALEEEHGPGLRGCDVSGGWRRAAACRAGPGSLLLGATVAATAALVGSNALPLRASPRRACSRAEWYVGTAADHGPVHLRLARQEHALFLDCRPVPTARTRTATCPSGSTSSWPIRAYAIRTPAHYTGGRRGRIARLLAGASRRAHLRDVGDRPWAELEPLLPEAIRARNSSTADRPGAIS